MANGPTVKSAKRREAEALLAARYRSPVSPDASAGAGCSPQSAVGDEALRRNRADVGNSLDLLKRPLSMGSSSPSLPLTSKKSKQARGFATSTSLVSSGAYSTDTAPEPSALRPAAHGESADSEPASNAVSSSSVLVKGCPPGCSCPHNHQPVGAPRAQWCSFDVSRDFEEFQPFKA